MGMFDTIHFLTPIKCVKCGDDVESTQTKAFWNLMHHFEMGDTVASRYLSGVLEENLHCHDCKHLEQDVYIVIYHRILIAVLEDEAAAHERLKRISKIDLEPLFYSLVGRLIRWRTDYYRLYRAVGNYREYLLSDVVDPTDSLLKTCLNDENPLLCMRTQVEEHPTLITPGKYHWSPSLGDLIKRMHELFERIETWRRKYTTLSCLVRDYIEWIELSPAERKDKMSNTFFPFWHQDAKECAEAEDPLARLLDKAQTGKTSYIFL